MPRPHPTLPLAVRRALVRIGADLRAARLRRRLPLAVVADRALTTRQTIARIERGDPRVATGTWVSVLFILGLLDRLQDVAAPGMDEIGQALALEQLPQRIASEPRRVRRGPLNHTQRKAPDE